MYIPNPNKNLIINVYNCNWYRIPIKTHIITKDDNIFDVVDKYAKNLLQNDDVLFLSEKVVAITQGRSYAIDDIKVSWLAKFLAKYVTKSEYGIGVSIPQTMQLAINEVGYIRIIIAAFIAFITKLFGIKGMFYVIAGDKVRGIDGPTEYTIAPYNTHATLIPKDPDKVSQQISDKYNIGVVIIDANDLGVNVLGASKDIDRNWASLVFADNPLGQTNEQTPLCIVRKCID